jgi:transposase
MENKKLGKKRKKLSIEEKAMAIGWRQENISNSEIARCLGCGLDAIGKLLAKTEDKPKNFVPPRQKGSGRPRKFTTEVLNDIQFHINREPSLTAGELKKRIPACRQSQAFRAACTAEVSEDALACYGHETPVDVQDDGEKAQVRQEV